MIVIRDTVFVFDLDDTLYKEIDYQSSGHKFVIDYLNSVFERDLSYLLTNDEIDKKNFFQCICNELNLSDEFLNSLLWLYRLHSPDINLDNKTKKFLERIKKVCHGLAIISDGRFITQKEKLISLGLKDIDILTSEEWGESKLGSKRFLEIEKRFSNAKQFIYVGDNIEKDFLIPNKLGWITFGIKDKGYNIHPQIISNVKIEF